MLSEDIFWCLRTCYTCLSILRLCYVDEGLRGWMNNVEKLQNGRAIVGHGAFAVRVDYKFVHTARTQGGPDGVDDHLARIDVRDQLRLSLGRVCPFLQEDYLWLLKNESVVSTVLNKCLTMRHSFTLANFPMISFNKSQTRLEL